MDTYGGDKVAWVTSLIQYMIKYGFLGLKFFQRDLAKSRGTSDIKNASPVGKHNLWFNIIGYLDEKTNMITRIIKLYIFKSIWNAAQLPAC